jgi:hypothetical protein
VDFCATVTLFLIASPSEPPVWMPDAGVVTVAASALLQDTFTRPRLLVSRSPDKSIPSSSAANPAFRAVVPFNLLCVASHLANVTAFALHASTGIMIVTGEAATSAAASSTRNRQHQRAVATTVWRVLDEYPYYQLLVGGNRVVPLGVASPDTAAAAVAGVPSRESTGALAPPQGLGVTPNLFIRPADLLNPANALQTIRCVYRQAALHPLPFPLVVCSHTLKAYLHTAAVTAGVIVCRVEA